MVETYGLKYNEDKLHIEIFPFEKMIEFKGIIKLNGNTFVSCNK